MFTLKYQDHRGSESVFGDVISTSFHEGALTAFFDDGATTTFGPNLGGYDQPASVPTAYLMNEAGATISKYQLFPMTLPEREKYLAQSEDAILQAAAERDRKIEGVMIDRFKEMRGESDAIGDLVVPNSVKDLREYLRDMHNIHEKRPAHPLQTHLTILYGQLRDVAAKYHEYPVGFAQGEAQLASATAD